jgi:predicted lipoprotein with Yx(FWY)xxD motif
MLSKTILAAMLTGLLSTAAFAAEPVKIAETAKGRTLTNEQGMTLYTFSNDAGGKSACNGPCATNWPPLAAPADAQPSGAYTVIKRDDGSPQWAYEGRPLYTWVKDQKPGDITGDGLNGVWEAATP